jgi:hypothetical protein
MDTELTVTKAMIEILWPFRPNALAFSVVLNQIITKYLYFRNEYTLIHDQYPATGHFFHVRSCRITCGN